MNWFSAGPVTVNDTQDSVSCCCFKGGSLSASLTAATNVVEPGSKLSYTVSHALGRGNICSAQGVTMCHLQCAAVCWVSPCAICHLSFSVCSVQGVTQIATMQAELHLSYVSAVWIGAQEQRSAML